MYGKRYYPTPGYEIAPTRKNKNITKDPTYKGNLRTFFNIPRYAQKFEEEKRKKMLGQLYVPNQPFSSPMTQKTGQLSENQKKKIEQNIFAKLQNNNTWNDDILTMPLENLEYIERIRRKGTIASDPGSRSTSPYGGKRKTRKSRRSTKRLKRKH